MSYDLAATMANEVADLRARLDEAEETLRAIGAGEVDAVVVGGQVYMLTSAEAASNQLRGRALATINDAVITVDNDDRVTWLNGAAERQYSVCLEDALGQPLRTIFACRWPSVENEAAAHVSLRNGDQWRGEQIHITKECREVCVESAIVVLRDDAHAPVGKLITARDVTESTRLTRELRISEQRFRDVADAAPVMLWLTDEQHGCTFLNRGWREFTGQLDEQGLGNGWTEPLHPDDRERVTQMFLEAASRRAPFRVDFRLRRIDGEYRWCIGTGHPRFDSDGAFVGYIGSVLEVHERKEAERELSEREERFRTLADNMSQFAWMADATGRIYWYNQRWYEYTGTTLEEMQRCGWTQLHHPDHIERVGDRIQQSWDTGVPWEDTFPLRRHDGEFRWFLSRALPIRNAEGTIIRWFGTHTDITQQREFEEALCEADRRKDEFLATLAHELRNPLAPIRTGLEIMRMSADNPSVITDTRETMERQLAHLVALVDDLLDVSRISKGKVKLCHQYIKLSTVFQDALDLCKPTIHHAHHQLHVDQPAEDITLFGDPHRLSQILSNLINNSAKYTPRGGNIWVDAQLDGNEVVIAVKDDGIGIAREQLTQVFEMFAQIPKPDTMGYMGLGIGLSLVKSFVELHGGTIAVASDGEGTGAVFSVRLPVATTPSSEANIRSDQRERKSVTAPTEESRKVLVVDDNHAAAKAMGLVIRLFGNEVRTAEDGRAAVEAAREFQPDLIIMDIGMPIMDGYAAAREIRAQPWGQEMVLIALTGWGQDEDKQKTKEAGFDQHLVKPVEPDSIRRLIESVPKKIDSSQGEH